MTINRATLPQEFFDRTTARLLLQPEPQYLHARLLKMALGASFDPLGSLGLPIQSREFGTNGATYTQNGEGRFVLSDGIYSETFQVVTELGKGEGHTIRMNRPVYANTKYEQKDREIPSGTVIDTTPSKIGSEQVSITVRRFAGPFNTTTNKVGPLGVDRFDAKFAMHKPAQMASLHLARDFDRTLDTFGVKLLDQANLIVRPDAEFTADNDHTEVGDGPMSWALLQNLERRMDEENIPQFANGKRVYVATPYQIEQLTLDPTYQRLARYEHASNPLYQGNYVADVGAWTIFKSNTLTKVTNANSIPVHYGQAFGPGSVGAGIGELPRAAYHTNDNYGETALVIWLMYAGFEVFDNRFIASVRTT